MANAQQTSFTSPGYDYSADVASIDQRRKLAEALRAQAMQGIPTPQTPAGGFTPRVSPMQGLEKLAQALMSATEGNRADEQNRELSAKSQADYAKMVSTGLRQLQGTPATPMQEDASSNVTPAQPAMAPDPVAAMATFGSHPMGQSLQPLAMQELSRQRLMEALRPPQGAPQSGAGGQTPPAYGQPGFAPSGGAAPSGAGPNLGMHLMTDPSGKSYVSALEKGGHTQGRVFYDQQGKAFTVSENGSMNYLPGVMARDKQEMVDTGGAVVPVNPFTQNQPIPKSLTPAQGLEIPMHQQRQWWETGLQPQGATAAPQAPRPAATTPAPAVPAPAPLPAAPVPASPVSQAVPPQAPPGAVQIPPRERAKMEEARPHQTQAAQGTLGALQNSIDEIDRLAKQPGLGRIVGPLASKTPNISGTATNAQANLDTLKSQIGVHTLNAMREASKSGGAVGSVTEKEWPILQNQLGALQQAQTEEEFRKNLETVRSSIARIQNNVRQSYESVYGQLQTKPQGDPLGIR